MRKIAHGKEGIGFYGLSHGLSVPVGSVQNTTWVTNEAGTYSGPQLNNTARVSDETSSVAGTVSVNAASAINLDQLPNYLCPLNIRFSNDDAVRVQECKLMIFDKNQTSNPASGVTTYVYEARHPDDGQGSTIPQLNHRGRTENSWVEFSESIGAIEMTMTPSPGASGLNGDSNDVNSAAVILATMVFFAFLYQTRLVRCSISQARKHWQQVRLRSILHTRVLS